MLLCKSCARGANQTLIKRGNPCLLILNCRLVSWVLGTTKVRQTLRCLTRMPDGTLGVAQGRIVHCGPLAPNKKRSLPQTASPRRVEMFSRKSIHLLEPPVWIMHFVSFCFIIRCGSRKRAIDRKQRAQPSGLAEDSEPVYTLVERFFPSWPPNPKALWLLAVTVHWPLKSRPSCEYITNDGSQPEPQGMLILTNSSDESNSTLACTVVSRARNTTAPRVEKRSSARQAPETRRIQGRLTFSEPGLFHLFLLGRIGRFWVGGFGRLNETLTLFKSQQI